MRGIINKCHTKPEYIKTGYPLYKTDTTLTEHQIYPTLGQKKLISISTPSKLRHYEVNGVLMTTKKQSIKKHTAIDALSEQSTEVAVMLKPTWRRKGGIFYVFSGPDETGKRSVMELTMKGSVVKSFLRAKALSHTVFIEASEEDIKALKSLIKMAPGFNEQGYRWPFEGRTVKFTSKRDLDLAFQFI
jgi:hypothetical protein